MVDGVRTAAPASENRSTPTDASHAARESNTINAGDMRCSAASIPGVPTRTRNTAPRCSSGMPYLWSRAAANRIGSSVTIAICPHAADSPRNSRPVTAAPTACPRSVDFPIIRHPIPLDLHTLKALKRSPLGLDLYFWLVYRTFTLKAPLTLSWKQLFRQFGADPAKVGKHSTVNRFRADCLRELKKIKRAWPNLHYATVTGGLVLSPSPPRIPPAQLQLIGE